jgi:hypothetical protein
MTERIPDRIRIEVEVHVPPGTDLAESVRWVDGLSDLDPDRHECEAALYIMLAKSAWRRAEQLRLMAADADRRRARRRRGVSG